MREYDVTEEDWFDTDPSRVFRALIDESAGTTHWWTPDLEIHPTSGAGAEIGSTFEMEVSARPRRLRWSGRVTERVEDRRLRAEFTDGDFVGEGLWTVDFVGGETRLRYRFHVLPNGVSMRLFAPFIDFARRHSQVMRRGFAALHGYLEDGGI